MVPEMLKLVGSSATTSNTTVSQFKKQSIMLVNTELVSETANNWCADTPLQLAYARNQESFGYHFPKPAKRFVRTIIPA